MGLFHVTTKNSQFSTAGAVDTFNGDTATPDTLIVDAGAYLLATGAASRGAFLGPFGGWTVTVNGAVFGKFEGIHLEDSNTGVSTITIGVDGQVAGSTGIVAASGVTIKNAGEINAEFSGIAFYSSDAHTVTNTGTIAGGTGSITDVDGLSIENVTNSGLIDGLVDLGGKDDTFTNTATGDVEFTVGLGEGNNKLTNAGVIDGKVTAGAGNDTVVNTKELGYHIELGDGNNKITNSGVLQDSVILGTGNDTVANKGTLGRIIGAEVNLGEGNNSLTNSGKLNYLRMGDGNDTIVNSGTIGTIPPFLFSLDLKGGDDKFTNSGTVNLKFTAGAGNDTVTNFVGTKSGTLTDVIDLGNGDDKFFGGNHAEIVTESDGSDVIKFGGGLDFYSAAVKGGTTGTDVIDGGAGIDIYDALFATNDVFINLDTVAHNVPGFGTINPMTAGGLDVGTDTISGFENASGGAGADNICGTAGANELSGSSGGDRLLGFGGNDTLFGGGDLDVLIGGLGADKLSGDTGQDYFQLQSVKDSTVGKAGRDVILDFNQGEIDQIDIELIDANTKNGATDDDFTYLNGNSKTTPGAMFTGTAGELRSYWSANGTVFEGDVNGDGKADFAIEVYDPTHAIALTITDFYQLP